MSTRSSRDGDPLGLLGKELTNTGTDRVGRITGRSNAPDFEVLKSECPGEYPDTGVAATVARLLGWSEARADAAIDAGIRAGYFRPE